MPDAIQSRIPNNRCFGCGPLNGAGLKIKSYQVGEETICTFQPAPQHMAGPPHVLNGGIIATVIDCHCVCTAISDAHRAAGRELGSEPLIWCVTGSLHVEYLEPVPIAAPVELRARVRESKGRKRVVECTLASGGRVCARAEVVAIEVPPSWREPGG